MNAQGDSQVTRLDLLPPDGSMYGWLDGGIVTALIIFYTERTPETPEPVWSVMPRAGVPERRWPLITDQPMRGDLFREYCQAGCLVSLDGLVADTEGAVFWADTTGLLGSFCIVVTRDLAAPEGFTLPGWHVCLVPGVAAGHRDPPGRDAA